MRNIKIECIQECFYDKELQTCGSCYRTLEDIKEAGITLKKNKEEDSFMGLNKEMVNYK